MDFVQAQDKNCIRNTKIYYYEVDFVNVRIYMMYERRIIIKPKTVNCTN